MDSAKDEAASTEAATGAGASSRRAVFHVVDSLSIGGAERIAVDISCGLAARGWQVHVVATRSTGPLAAQLTNASIPLHELDRASRLDLRGLRAFRKLVRRHRPAIVHAHGWSSLQFATAALTAIRKAPKLVFHDHRPAGLPPIGWAYRAAAWPKVRAHIAADQALLAHPPPTLHRTIRVAVANGSAVERFEPKQTYEIDQIPRLVMLANLRPQKAHPVFFEALATLATRGLGPRVDLLGATDDPVYLASCRAQLDRLGLSKSVNVAGSHEDVGGLLASYDLGVLSSTTESGPVALIEYLASGLPFVVTDVGNVTASLPSRLRRWAVEPGDQQTLADRIEEALNRPAAERRADAAVGIEFARNTLSIDRTLTEIEDVYRQLLRSVDPLTGPPL